ncbi:MAG: response regulator transcription factor [Bacteroidetes bacterium]|nr:response regulator transcription factor [Bacteroidota bacterium]
MIKAVIVEDEKKSREALAHLLQKNCPDISIIGVAETVKEGIEVVHNQKPELIFLDVMLPDGSGFDVLEKVNDLKFDVIFATASEKFAVKAIRYSALDYLLKPIDEEELKTAVKKVTDRKSNTFSEQNMAALLENIKKSDEQFSKITLPTGNVFEVVLVKDIIRCEANDNYTNVYLADPTKSKDSEFYRSGKKFLVSGTLKHYEELLPEKDFIRVHHSHLINKEHMIRFLKEDGGYAVMSDGTKVEVSRRKREEFLKKLK